MGYKLTYIDHNKPVSEKSVVVRSSGNGKFQQYVQMGNHLTLADEPENAGGNGTGPDPYSFLLASLGTCTSMTLKMYADHKDLPLEGVEVHLKHDKVHGDDYDEGSEKSEMLDHITREIVIKGEKLTDEQKHRMIEIADKCPVHRTLHGDIIVKISERK